MPFLLKQSQALRHSRNEAIFKTRILLIVVYLLVSLSAIFILNKFIFTEDPSSQNRMIIEIGLALAMIPIAYYLSGVMLKLMTQVIESQRNFIANVNHELQNPISLMKLNSEIVLSGEPSCGEITQTVRENIVQLNKISETLKILTTLASHNYGLGQIPFTKIDLGYIAKKATNSVIRQFITEKNIDIKFLGNLNMEIPGNATALEEMVYNLVKNSVLYTPEGGSVSVMVKNKDKHVELTVEDTGIGIDKKDLPYVFHPFYRASDTVDGSGLGLPIVKEIAKHHNAELKIQSKVGQGTKITALFPLAN